MASMGQTTRWKMLAGVAIMLALIGWLVPRPEVAATRTARAGGTGSCTGVHIRFFAGGDAGDAFASVVYHGAQAAAADLGAQVDYIFSGWDPYKMISQLRDAVAARPDGIAMMGHPGDAAIFPLARRAQRAGIAMEYQNVDVPRVRAALGGGYIGADLKAQGTALGLRALRDYHLKAGMHVIIFGGWDVPARVVREAAVASVFEHAGIHVQRIINHLAYAADPNLLTPVIAAAVLKQPDIRMIVYDDAGEFGAVPQYMRAIHRKPGQIINIGFDTSPQIMRAFRLGYVQLSSDQQPYLQGYLPILSLCLTKKYGVTPLSVDTGAGFIDVHNYRANESLVQQGIR